MQSTSFSRLKPFLAFYTLCLIAQFGGGYFTQMSVTTWYPTLTQSPLTPPGMWFGVVWSILYILMAVAAMRVWRITYTVRCHALRWWLIQLILGFIWSVVFFGHRDVASALQVIAAMWVAVAMTILLFRRHDRLAARLMLPLLVWLSFAAYLNFYILTHN